MNGNVSVVLFALAGHYSSPFFEQPLSHTSGRFSLARSKFLCFAQHLYFSRSSLASLSVKFTKFQDFLSSAIAVNTQDYEHELYQNQNLILRDRGDLLFTDCVFDTCVSNSAGGAIQLYADTLKDSELSLIRCLFQSCTANMHGGAVYALVARYYVIDSCFAVCSARDRQAALFRGESPKTHTINTSVICFCGRGSGDRTTFSTSSSSVAIINVNSSYNNVDQYAAGYYLESNRMAFMKFSVFSGNCGVNVLNYRLKSEESAFEYVNLLNNSASHSWKTLIYTNAKVSMGHFYFVQNSKPLIITEKAIGGALFIACIFDAPLHNGLFIGSCSHTQCEFDVESPSFPVYSTFRKAICVNRFTLNEDDTNSDALIWWSLFLAICGISGYLFFFGSPKSKKEDDRIRFRRWSRRFPD
jgi:hypothetical protein